MSSLQPVATPQDDAKFAAAGGRAREADIHSGQAKFAWRLQDLCANRLMHVHGLGWHVWDGRRWIPDQRGAATQYVMEMLRAELADSLGDPSRRKEVRRVESASGLKGILDIASSLPRFAVTADDLDADPYLLNTPSGTLDLRTGTLQPARPDDRITKVTGGAYRPHERSQDWERFLEHVLPDREVRGFLQRLAGLGLLGVVREHILPIFTGTGANGKGTFDRAFSHALGDYAIAAEPELLMANPGSHPTGQMDLLGVRWCVVSESDEGRSLAAGTVKRLTGGDPIRARRMRQDFVEFDPSHTAVLITNHLPKVDGGDPAMWRRLRVVPFDVVISPEEMDKGLDETLRLAADAILTWAVQGYQDYADLGGLDEPDSVLAATAEYREKHDAIGRFLGDDLAVVRGPSYSTTVSELYARFGEWARGEIVTVQSRADFTEQLTRHGYTPKRTKKSRGVLTGIAPVATHDAHGDAVFGATR
ncbi:DNA primase family protein [Nocardioides sp. MAHUQ-72]|uniref:DNA primase family protein n=1 Tax=unclassified Nocardioides TaxID=2615069 RepID=UPI00361516DA